MADNDQGMQALANAARLEAARVYGNYSPEWKATPRDMVEEVRHFAEFGWAAGRIAIRLRITKAEVYRLLGSAA